MKIYKRERERERKVINADILKRSYDNVTTYVKSILVLFTYRVWKIIYMNRMSDYLLYHDSLRYKVA